VPIGNRAQAVDLLICSANHPSYCLSSDSNGLDARPIHSRVTSNVVEVAEHLNITDFYIYFKLFCKIIRLFDFFFQIWQPTAVAHDGHRGSRR
jgi:hypothetical protein